MRHQGAWPGSDSCPWLHLAPRGPYGPPLGAGPIPRGMASQGVPVIFQGVWPILWRHGLFLRTWPSAVFPTSQHQPRHWFLHTLYWSAS